MVGEKGIWKIQTWEPKAKGHFVLEIGVVFLGRHWLLKVTGTKGKDERCYCMNFSFQSLNQSCCK